MADQRNKKSWKDAPEVARAADKPASKGKQIFSVLAMIGILVGVIVGVVMLLRPTPKPTFIPVAVSQYDDPLLPANAQADDDRKALSSEQRFAVVKELFTTQEKSLIEGTFSDLRKKQPKDRVVVYLNAFVVASSKEDGELLLLPGRAEIDRPETGIKLRALLADMQQCPADRKLLILDVMRPIADPRLGVLANDVAARLETLLNDVKDDKRLVLCACSPGQVTFSSDVLHRTVFGYYLAEGLYGWADGYSGKDKKKDGRVTVEELARFVRARVDRWARQNRGTRQTPTLYGPEALARDFELASVREPFSHEETGEVEAYPDWLKTGWRLRELWWQDGTYRVTPLVFRALETRLLYAEQRWRGGINPDTIKPDLADQMKALRGQAERAWAALPKPTPHSLALAAALPVPADLDALLEPPKPVVKDTPKTEAKGETKGEAKAEPKETPKKPAPEPPSFRRPDPKAEYAEQVKALNQTLDDLDETRRRMDPKEMPKILADRSKEFLKAYKDKPPFELAWVVFETAAEKLTLKPEQVQFLDDLLREGGQPRPQYVETLLLRRLAALAQQQGKPEAPAWDAETVRLVLIVARDGEQAATCAAPRRGPDGGWEPRALPWVRPALDQAAQDRHDGEVMLFNPGYASTAQAVEKLRSAEAGYRTALAQLGTLHAAFRAYDEALLVLPAVARGLLSRPDIESATASAWKQNWNLAIDAWLAIDKLFAREAAPAQVRDRINDLDDKTRLLRANLEALTRPFTTRLPELIEAAARAQPDASLWPDFDAAFEVPLLPAQKRVELWDARQKLATRLNDRTHEIDQRDDAAAGQTEVPGDDDSRGARAELERAAWRAQTAIDLLRLGGLSGSEGLGKELAKARQEADKPATWPILADKVRAAWSAGLRKQIEGATLAAADRLSRVAHPFDRLPFGDDVTRGPGMRLQQEAAAELWRWNLDRYDYELHEARALAEARAVDDDVINAYERLFRADYARRVEGKSQPALDADLQPASDKYEPLRLESGGKSEPARIRVRLTQRPLGGKAFKPTVAAEAVTADLTWLEAARPQVPELSEGQQTFELAYLLSMPRDAGRSGGPQPRGALARVVVNGRSFHHKINTALPIPKNRRLQLLLTTNPDQLTDAPDTLRLRPNTQQNVYVFVRNPTDQPRKVNVEVKAEDNPRLSAQTEKEVLVPKGGVPVPVKLAGRGGPTAAAGGKERDVSPLSEIKGKLVFILKDAEKNNEEIETRPIAIDIDEPKNYLDADAIYLPGDKNELMVTVKARRPLGGDPCQVRLVMERFEGYLSAKGNTSETVTDKEPAVIRLQDLQFAGELNQQRFDGKFYLTVDGWERAFAFKATFLARGSPNPPPVDKFFGSDLRLRTPGVVRPGAEVKAFVEVDNQPNVTLVVEEDRSRTNNFREVLRCEGERRVRKYFDPARTEGALTFETKVTDWDVALNVRDFIGELPLRVRMLRDGREIDRRPGSVVIDGTPPEKVRFTTFDKRRVQQNSETNPHLVKAGGPYLAQAEGEDPESKIKEVFFFLGEPAGRKRPETVKQPIKGSKLDGEGKLWETKNVILAATLEVQKVTVEFVNGAGESEFATIYVQVEAEKKAADATKKDDGPKTGTLKAIVTLGERPQPNKSVKLKNLAPNAPAQTETTDEKGEFVFKDLQPGKYTVQAISDDGRQSAEVPLEIKAGDNKTQVLPISIQKK